MLSVRTRVGCTTHGGFGKRVTWVIRHGVLLAVCLLRRDRQGHNVAWLHRHFFANRRPVTPDRVGKKTHGASAPNEVSWDVECLGGIAGSESQPDSLASVEDIHYHVAEALILYLHHRRFSWVRAGLLRAAGTANHQQQEENRMTEEGHGISL